MTDTNVDAILLPYTKRVEMTGGAYSRVVELSEPTHSKRWGRFVCQFRNKKNILDIKVNQQDAAYYVY